MERANIAAQNSILKMLEEPASGVLWILECSRRADLLPTIPSRCVQVHFDALTRADVERVLSEHGVTGERAAAFARWSKGSPGEALRCHAQHEWEQRALLVEVLRGGAPPLVAAAAAWKLDGTFEGKTAKAIERARLRTVLDLALAIVRDLVRARAGVEAAGLAHGDLAARAGEFQAARSDATLGAALDTLLTLRRDVESNIDPPLLLDRAFRAGARAPATSGAALDRPRRRGYDPRAMQETKERLRQIALADGRDSPEAYYFLFEVLESAVRLAGKEGLQGSRAT